MKVSQIETGESSKTPTPTAGINRGMSVLDIILRLVAVAATLAGAIAMANSDQQLQFFTQGAIFNVEYEDFSTFWNFVVINSLACAYFALSIPLAILTIARSTVIVHQSDTGATYVAASAATAILQYLFTDFCHRASASLIGSFAAIVVLLLLVLMSTAALARS